MNTPRRALTLLALGLGVTGGAPADEARQLLALDDGWRFAFAPDAEDPAAFVPVHLPHTWNTADSNDKTRPYRRDVGVYRRELVPDAALAGRPLYLAFEGANQVSTVFVNGRLAGRHAGGYTGFAFDVTDLFEPGRRNEIEVRVDNRHDDTIPPLNADFTFYGGLYRDAWLIAPGGVHFAIDEYGATALDVRTTRISAGHATLAIGAGLRNATPEDRVATVTVRILGADGAEAGRTTAKVTVPAGELAEPTLDDIGIDGPALWSPEAPNLYRAVATIETSGTIVDEIDSPLGLRWFEADPERGFLLNGRPYRLFGTNRHQDRAGIGNALPDALHRADLERIRADGFNFLRLAHYPQDPAVLAAADELGLVVWEEIPVVNLIGLAPAFGDNAERMLREMIRQHRRHPSIAFWGYMNEVTLVQPEPLPEGYYDAVVTLAERLERVVEEEDPSRLTVMALSRDELERSPAALQSITDVLAFNLYFGWYYGDFAALGAFLDEYRERHPDRPLMVSEYGAGSDRRVHARGARAFDFSMEYQQDFHEANFAQVLERPWLVGSAVWNQFDFGSYHRQDTMFAINQKGLWTYDRVPKDIAFYYRALLADDPVLHIATRDWPLRAGSRPEDALMPVKVYGNAAAVTLTINGESQGRRPVTNGSATWNLRFRPGTNTLAAVSAHAHDETIVEYEDRSAFLEGREPHGRIAVNAGGHEQVVAGGTAFEADRDYVTGSWGHVGGEPALTHHRIFGTDLDPLYQSQRRGEFAYRFDVPDGRYCTTLHMASFDTFEAGTRREELRATGGRGLSLDFGGGMRGAFVNGIELTRGACTAP